MFYGFAPAPPLLPPPAPPLGINVWAYKNSGVQGAATASAGALSFWNSVYNTKINSLVQFQGDWGNTWVGWGALSDADWVAVPQYGAFQ